MKKTIEMDGVNYDFNYEDGNCQVIFPESRTRVKERGQLALLERPAPYFVTAVAKHEHDAYIMNYTISEEASRFDAVLKMTRLEKLRALKNVGTLERLVGTRFTFFIHPENLVFDDNLMPQIIHRGLKDILPPYELSDGKFFKQYQALIIAMFSKKYNFDNLYSGAIQNARGTAFEKQITEAKTVQELTEILQEAYIKEQQNVEKNLALIPRKKFRTFKGLAIGFIIAALILAVPLGYFAFFKVPYQDRLLTANENFLKTDYSKVITDLEDEKPENLPQTAKYQLAFSYLQGEQLDDKKKENIMKTLSLKSDQENLLYWIYNGRGDFDASLDTGKRLQDNVLILYALTKQLEEVQNDKSISGDQAVEKQTKIEEELKKYQEKLTSDEEKSE
ncbi:type VII secretion protein EssB [Listeria floridensis]|nr:type VII secretion protein EssB [Listeria floridensis]